MNHKITRKKSLWKRLHENKRFLAAESIVLPILFGIILMILWQREVLHKWMGTDTFTLPLPSRIMVIISDNTGKILSNAQSTVIVAIVGLLAGSLIGYIIAVLAAIFPRGCKSGVTIVAAFNAIPIVALAPVLTNLTKDVSRDANIRSMVAKILVVTIVCMANMSINAYRGLTDLKPFAEDFMSTLAAPKYTVLTKLRMPNSIPYVFTALKVSVPSCVISALVSEYFAEYIIGVGRQIRENIVLAQYATAWAYIVVACFIGIVMYAILMLVQEVILRRRGC